MNYTCLHYIRYYMAEIMLSYNVRVRSKTLRSLCVCRTRCNSTTVRILTRPIAIATGGHPRSTVSLRAIAAIATQHLYSY